MTLRVLLILLCATTPCLAHQSSADVAFSREAWSYDPWLTVPLYALGLLFLVGTRTVWGRAGFGRGVRRAHVACFWAAWLLLALATLSPLHWLSERLFTAHMLEHSILMVVVAPLFVLARPLAAVVWGLPAGARSRINAVRASRPIATALSFLSGPLTATTLHALALWGWHLPALYQLALRSDAVHRLQHLSFLASALLFWWVLLQGRSQQGEDRLRDGVGFLCLFVTSLHSGLLGALITLSRRLWYPAQTVLSEDWGLSPLEDQQLAGLVMWVPMGVIYAAAALYVAARWLKSAQAGPIGRESGAPRGA
jgi:putative membrane protein